MITAHHLVFGRKYGGLFKIPFLSSNRIRFGISTRYGSIIVKNLDGTLQNINPYINTDLTLSNNNNITPNYSSFYSGDLEVTTLSGNGDVYSIFLNYSAENAPTSFGGRYNILNIVDFWEQFPNLFSIHYNIYAYLNNTRQPTIKGNLIKLPDSVERVRIQSLDVLNRTTYVYINLNEISLTSKLKWWSHEGNDWTLVYLGDLAKLPSTIQYFSAKTTSSNLTYTSGKVWASSFDTLDLGNASLSASETDNLFNDMANSITTAIGSKVIRLANCCRTSASNSAVAYLQSLGFTITVNVGDKILEADATTYTSGTVWNDNSGNANHITLQTAYAKDATYGGNIKFTNGSAEATFEPISSKYFTLIFWIKMDVLTNYNQNIQLAQIGDTSFLWTNRFSHHSSSTGHIYAGVSGATANRFELNSVYNTTTPKMIAFAFGNGELKLYINGSLFATKNVGNPGYANFTKLLLGNNGADLLNAKLGRVLLYSYHLNDSEISTEFNNNKTRFGL